MNSDKWQEVEQKIRSIPKNDLNIKSILFIGSSFELTFNVKSAKLKVIYQILDLAAEITSNLSFVFTIQRSTTPDDDYTFATLEINQASESSKSSYVFCEKELEIAENWEGGTSSRDFETETPCSSLDELKEHIRNYLEFLYSQGYEIVLDNLDE